LKLASDSALLTNAEGNPRDEVVAEAVLEAVENFLAAVADDFREPHAAIDSDEQSALVEPGRLGVRGDVRIDEMIPDADDFGFGAASVETELVQDPGQDIGNRLRPERFPAFHRRKVYAAPFGKSALARGRFRRAEWRNASDWGIHWCSKLF